MNSELPAAPVPPLVAVMRLIGEVAGPDPQARKRAFGELTAWGERDARFAPAQMGLGIGLALQGQLDAALAHFERSVRLDPKLAAAWSNLGNIHRMQGRLKAARSAYERAIALDPALADAHYNLSQIFDLQGEPAKALDAVRRALLFRPAYGEAHNNLGHLLLKAGKVDEACSHFRQALVFQPALRPARFNLVLALYRLGRTVEAQAEVDKLLAETPDDPQVLRVQAAGLAQQGRLEDAEAVNRRLMEREPDAADLQFNLGEVLLSRQDHEGALEVYRELLQRRGVPPAVVIGAMANVTYAQGKYSEAQALYRQALMSDGKRAQLALGLGRAHLAGGDVRLGLEALKRAVDLAPEAADLQALLIDALRFERLAGAKSRADEWARWRTRHTSRAPKVKVASKERAATTTRVKGDAVRVGLLVGELSDPVQLALKALQQTIAQGTGAATTSGSRRKAGAPASGQNQPPISWHIYACVPSTCEAAPLAAGFEHWRPIFALGTDDLLAQWKADGIDVLVDLVGLGAGSRLQALFRASGVRRAAWAGMIGGEVPTPPYDCILIDAIAAAGPATLQCLYPWEPRDPGAGVTKPTPVTADGAVAEREFTFGAMAPWSHIQDAVLDTWAEILQNRPDARFVLVSTASVLDEALMTRLGKLLALREIDPARVSTRGVPSGETASASVHKRLDGIDLLLDTFPVPMGATAFEVLSAGIPLVTWAGEQAWQRSTASVLAAAGRTEDIAHDRADYVQRACTYAERGVATAGARETVRNALQKAPGLLPSAWAQDFVAAVMRVADIRE